MAGVEPTAFASRFANIYYSSIVYDFHQNQLDQILTIHTVHFAIAFCPASGISDGINRL